MSNSDARRPWLSGIVPPLVTPLLDHDRLDVAGLERLIHHVLRGGVKGIFILGTTGEAPSLSYSLRKELIAKSAELVGQRVPLLVGITDTAFVESLEVARVAAEHGAAAVVLSTPYYFPAGQTELTTYIRSVVQACPLPIMLYNIPSLTKVAIEPATVQEFVQEPRIVGVKDSGGDIDYFGEIVGLAQQREDWSVMMGPEHLMAWSVRAGGSGGVNGGANILPGLFTKLYKATCDGNIARANLLQQQVERLQAIYDVGKYASRFIKATKCALSINEICSDHMAEPFNHFLPPEREKVRAILQSLKFDN